MLQRQWSYQGFQKVDSRLGRSSQPGAIKLYCILYIQVLKVLNGFLSQA